MDLFRRGPFALLRRRRWRTESQPFGRTNRRAAIPQTTTAPASGPMEAVPTPETSPPPVEPCIICCEPASSDQALVRICGICNNVWCSNCVRRVFKRAIECSSEMPPRCCVTIPLHLGSDHLSEEEVEIYKRKFEEWATPGKDRVYCPEIKCAELVPLRAKGIFKKEETKRNGKEEERSDSPMQNSSAFTAEIAVCEKCNTEVCLSCRLHAHNNRPCNPGTVKAEDDLVTQLGKWGYKRCPRCCHGVRKMFGCAHMQCVCGEHWCWWCARTITECENSGDCEGSVYENETDQDDGSESDDGDHTDDGAGMPHDENGTIEAAEGALIPDINPRSDRVEQQPAATSSVTDQSSGERGSHLEAPPPENQDQATRRPMTPPPRPAVVEIEPPDRRRRRRRRNSNLDAGTAAYWDRQGLNFGNEPAEENHQFVVWNDGHWWDRMSKWAYGASDSKGADEDGNAKAQGTTESDRECSTVVQLKMECHYCWTEIWNHPAGGLSEDEICKEMGRAWQCKNCMLVVCKPCIGRIANDFGHEKYLE